MCRGLKAKMDTKGSIEGYVEDILIRADKRVLMALSPTYRCMILVLRHLVHGASTLSDIEALVEGRGIKCRSLQKAVDILTYFDFISCTRVNSDKRCELTGLGLEMSSALYEFVESLRSFVYGVLDGTASDNDIVANLVTSIASTIGFIESYIEEPSLAPIYVAIHMYISGLTALVLALLSRVDARVLSIVRSFGFEQAGVDHER